MCQSPILDNTSGRPLPQVFWTVGSKSCISTWTGVIVLAGDMISKEPWDVCCK